MMVNYLFVCHCFGSSAKDGGLNYLIIAVLMVLSYGMMT